MQITTKLPEIKSLDMNKQKEPNPTVESSELVS